MNQDEYFSTAHERERPIFEAVHQHLGQLGPVHVEYLAVGIFFKNPRRVASLRTMTRWVALGFALPEKLQSSRLSRKVTPQGSAFYHVVNIKDASEIDAGILGWLTQAWHLD